MTAARTLVLLLVLLLTGTASAHEVGLSRGSYSASGDEVTAQLWFAGSEVDETVAERLSSRVQVRVSPPNAVCVQVRRHVERLPEEQAVSLRLGFRCPAGAERATVTIDFFDDLPRGHRHSAHTASTDSLLSATDRSLELPSSRPIALASTSSAVASFIRLGLEHILTGYDHLLFVLGLVLVRARASALLKAISAFTLAHSLTLACAVLGLWSPPSRFVEPVIAFSIAFVGWQNLRARAPAHRSLVTFGFGLVHGLGFAGALLETKLPPTQAATALLGFNLGVELGQLLIASAVWLMLGAVRRWQRPRVARVAELALNGGVLAAGTIWLIVRLRAGYLT